LGFLGDFGGFGVSTLHDRGSLIMINMGFEMRVASESVASLHPGSGRPRLSCAASLGVIWKRTMKDIFTLLIPLALGAVLVALGFGLYSLYRGGDYARSRSNKLMRLRVLLQFIAVVVLMAAFWWRSRGG